MHSSRMRTVRLLPVSPSMHCSRGCTCPRGDLLQGCTCQGVPAQGGVPAQEVYLPGGVPALGGSVPAQGGYLPKYSPPVNRMTGAKILLCPKLRLRAVILCYGISIGVDTSIGVIICVDQSE